MDYNMRLAERAGRNSIGSDEYRSWRLNGNAFQFEIHGEEGEEHARSSNWMIF